MTQDRRLQRLSWTRFGRLSFLSLLLAFAAGAQEPCPAGNPTGGRDFRGQEIRNGNFSYQDLTNADFSNATLIAPYFAYANLKNANFQGAKFISNPANPAKVSDFSFANLEKTCFIGASFEGPNYFTNATLTCADFSEVRLMDRNGTPNVIFGDSQLVFDRSRSDCRLAFRKVTLDCEFLKDWRYLDLARADISACAGRFAGQDFLGAKLNNVSFEGANLNGTKFVRADLSEANLKDASLIGADLSYATLLGASLVSANLTNASLYHAFLSNDTGRDISNAASLLQAHLKNANLSYAQLSGVEMSYANFYGEDPASAAPCQTAASISQCGRTYAGNHEGFACDCAVAYGATMRETNLTGAYLFGLDLTSAQMQGVKFQEAILTGASLKSASISSTPSATKTNFNRAFLQGASFAGAQFQNTADLSDAFVDFRDDGNRVYILLDGTKHNMFACSNCSPPRGQPVCVDVTYPLPTIPRPGVDLVCPNKSTGDCGAPVDSNKKWQSTIPLPNAAYKYDSTYIEAPANPPSVCGPGRAPTIDW